jgi:hypothetical protein
VAGVVAAAAAVAGAGWLLLREQDDAPEDEPAPQVEAPPARPVEREDAAPVTPRPRSPADAPREALYDPSEDLPAAPPGLQERLVSIPDGGRADDHRVVADGRQVRAALLAIPGLYLRWQDERVKDRFLATRHLLPPDAAPLPGGQGPAGSPLVAFAGIASNDDFRLVLRPPALLVGEGDWNP